MHLRHLLLPCLDPDISLRFAASVSPWTGCGNRNWYISPARMVRLELIARDALQDVATGEGDFHGE